MDSLAFILALQAEGKTAEEVKSAVDQYIEDNPTALDQAAVEAILDGRLDDVVLAQQAQPVSEDNRIWFPTTERETVQVPTYEEYSELKSALTELDGALTEEKIALMEWTQGNIKSDTGANANSGRFIRTSKYFNVTSILAMSCVFDSGNYNQLMFDIMKYDANGNYLGYIVKAVDGTYNDIDLTGVATVRFLIETTSGDTQTVISPSDGNDILTVKVKVFKPFAYTEDFTYDTPIKMEWERGKIGSNGNNSASTSTTHIRTGFRYLIPKTKFKLTVPENVTVSVYLYSAVCGSAFIEIEGSYALDTEIEVTANTYIRLMAFYTNGGDMALSVGNSVIVTYEQTFDELSAQNMDDKLSELCSMSMFSDIGILGDSFASGSLHMPNNTYVQNYAMSWGQILGRNIGAEVTNFSDGGLSTKTWLANTSVGLSALLADTPKQLYILDFGINDNTQIEAETLTLGSVADIKEDYTQNPDTFFGDYARIIGNIKTHAPKALIIVLSVARPNERNMDAYIQQIANACDVPFISLLDDNYFISGYFYGSISQGHPLAYGYSGMAKAIERLINRYIVKNPSYFYNYDGLTS